VSGCEDVFQGVWCLVFGSRHRLQARDKQRFWRLVTTDHTLTANAIPRTGLPAGYPGVDLEGECHHVCQSTDGKPAMPILACVISGHLLSPSPCSQRPKIAPTPTQYQ
jgi:hypothetical protein